MRAVALWKMENIIREEVEILSLPLQWELGEGKKIKTGEGNNQVGSSEFTLHPKFEIQEGGDAR